MSQLPAGLYAITGPYHSGVDQLAGMVEAAIDGGARVVQYRDKSGDSDRRIAEAARLRSLCQARGVPLIVNDDIALACRVGADGVHLGGDDGTIADARRELPAGAIIGRSCYNRFDLAVEAAEAGADYVAFGSFFPSPTKPGAVRASTDLLRRARSELDLPTVAIGGITPENGAALVAAGASLLAVISAVFAAPDITHATRAFAPCFTTSRGDPA
jgi:thiamine-phosphate pyrophosphorylase